MFAGKLLLVFLFFLCMSLSTSSMASSAPQKTPLDGSELVGINDTSTVEGEALQIRDNNSSQDDSLPILNSTLKGMIPLGKGKPLSMAINPGVNTLYVISPSELNGKLQNVIYVINSATNQKIDIIKIGDPEHDFLRNIAVDPINGTLYVTGEYRVNKQAVTYEYDSLYFINPNTKDYKRLPLYSEPEEGKEGDLSGVATSLTSKVIYVGSLYPEGGNPGIYVVDGRTNSVTTMIDKWESGIQDVLVSPDSREVYAIAKYDNLLSVINDSTNTISKNITTKDPISMSFDSERHALFVANGYGEVSTIDLFSGKNTTSLVEPYLQDISYDPSSKQLYIVALNKTMQLSKANSGPVSKVIGLDTLSGKYYTVFETDATLANVIPHPSSGIVYVLGSDANNSKLYLLQPSKFS
jgi:DNA-binding beta-propeller fold protein YncE